MSNLEPAIDLASVLAGSNGAWNTLHASGRAWSNLGRARRALVRRRATGGTVRVIADDQLGERDQEWSIWREGPYRTRSEFVIGREPITVVTDGVQWWRASAVLGSTSGSVAMRPAALLLGPPGVLVFGHQFLEQLDLFKIVPGTMAGRAVHRLSGRPTARRTAGRFFLREAGLGAEHYVVSLDAETGVVLGIEAFAEGEAFRIIETTSIDYGMVFSPSVFAAAPKGSSRAPSRGRGRARVDPSNLELSERFTVLLPVPPPTEVEPHFALFESDHRSPGPQRLVVTYPINRQGWGRGQLRLTEAAHDLGHSLRDEWQNHGTYEVCVSQYGRVPRRRVRAKRAGTYLELDSTVVPTDALIEILDTLQPVTDR